MYCTIQLITHTDPVHHTHLSDLSGAGKAFSNFRGDGSTCINIKEYHKTTHIDRYLLYTSHHPQSCQIFIALKKNLRREERCVKKVLKANGYIESIIRSAKRLKEKRKEEETPK